MAVLVHLLVDQVVAKLAGGKIASEAPSTTIFNLETQRMIVDWLIVTSAVIIGLGVRSAEVTALLKGGFISLGICIFVGLVFTSILAGGAHSQNNGNVTISKPHLWTLAFLLNILFMLFIFGVSSVLASFLRG